MEKVRIPNLMIEIAWELYGGESLYNRHRFEDAYACGMVEAYYYPSKGSIEGWIGRTIVAFDMPKWFLKYWERGNPEVGLKPLQI